MRIVFFQRFCYDTEYAVFVYHIWRLFMALDGIVISNIVTELSDRLANARISKIAQPEADELLLTIKGTKGQYRLLLSAGASLPLFECFLYFIAFILAKQSMVYKDTGKLWTYRFRKQCGTNRRIHTT